MPASGLPENVPFFNLNDLPRPNTGSVLTYVQFVDQGAGPISTGDRYVWSDVDNDYINLQGLRVVGSWSPTGGANGTPDYTTALTENNTALSVSAVGTITFNGEETLFQQGDLIIRSSAGVFYADHRGARNVFRSIEFLRPGNDAANQDGNFSVAVDALTGLLDFYRREQTVEAEKTAIGESIHTDVIFTSGVLGGLKYEDANGVIREVLRLSTNGTLWSAGDEQIQMSMVSDGPVLVITPNVENAVPFVIQSESDETQSGTTHTFEVTVPATGRIESVTVSSTGSSRANVRITDISTNPGTDIITYETDTDENFERNNGGDEIPAGEHTLPLQGRTGPARVRQGITYRVDIESVDDITFDGHAVSGTFIPKLTINMITVTVETTATREWVNSMLATILENNILAGSGISKQYNAENNTVTISATGAEMYNNPAISNLRINLADRVDVGTNLNVAHTITYEVEDHENLQSLTLNLSNGDNIDLTLPTSDGEITQTVTFANVVSNIAGSVVLQIVGQNTRNEAITPSNSKTIRIANVAAHEFIYYGFSASDNDDTIAVESLQNFEAMRGTQRLNLGPTAQASQYLIILAPADHLLTAINDSLNRNQLQSPTAWVTTTAVRQLNSVDYTSYVLGPLTNGYSATLNLEVS